MKKCLFLIIFILSNVLVAQNNKIDTNVMSLNEYIGYIKQFHPSVKQANLKVNRSQAEILSARGSFDPKIEVDYDTKQFKNSEYYSILNSTFKIPTWYGIDIKAGFDKTEGIYLNPENNNPVNGLATLGINVPLGQGLFINKRMAVLKQAKIFNNLTKAERDIEIANILHQAIRTYIEWYKNHEEYKLYDSFFKNSSIRFSATKKLILNGDRPAIDSVEAGILVKTRKLQREQSRLKLIKSKLDLSVFLWLDNNIPLELQDQIVPENNIEQNIAETLKTNELLNTDIDLANHPKIKSLQFKIDILNVEKKLKGEMLKPKLDLSYNYISEPVYFNDFNVANYKYGINFSLPLFLRKERGDFKIAKFKLQDAQLDLTFENLALKNKIEFQFQEISSLKEQMKLSDDLVKDFKTMLTSEERLFFFGESSMFIINTRENNLLSSNLQQISTNVNFCNSNVELFKLLVNQL